MHKRTPRVEIAPHLWMQEPDLMAKHRQVVMGGNVRNLHPDGPVCKHTEALCSLHTLAHQHGSGESSSLWVEE